MSRRFDAVIVESSNPTAGTEVSMAISPALRVTGMVEDPRHIGLLVIEEYSGADNGVTVKWIANLLWVEAPFNKVHEVADTVDNIVNVYRYEKRPAPARLR